MHECCFILEKNGPRWVDGSVTILGDLLDLGNISKPLATINLPNLPRLLDNFCIGVEIFNFSSEIAFGQLL